MLRRIEKMPSNVLVVIVYVNSPSLEFLIRRMMKEKFRVDSMYVLNVENERQLNSAKLDSLVEPLQGGKWLINVNTDKLKENVIVKYLDRNTDYGVTVYYINNYKKFKKITEMQEVKRLGSYAQIFNLFRLGYGDVIYLFDKVVGDRGSLDKKLLDFVAKTYRYDVQAIFDLFSSIKSGEEYKTKREIIEEIGVGGNSVDRLVLKLLTTNFQTEKGIKRVYSDVLKLMDDLAVSYNYHQIRRYMLNAVNAIMDIKMLQIMGVYGRRNVELPEGFDENKLLRYQRFSRVILEKVSMARILNLKLCLQSFSHAYAEISLLQIVSEYIKSLDVS